MQPILVLLLCLLMGGNCEVTESRVTVYAPQLGGINCQEPCDITASGRPVEYGVTAACSRERLGDLVFIVGVGFRRCDDTGGMINGTDIDVAIPAEECVWARGYCTHPWSQPATVIFADRGGNASNQMP